MHKVDEKRMDELGEIAAEKKKQLRVASFLFLFGYILVLLAVNISPLSVYYKFAITGGMIALIGIYIKVGSEWESDYD